MKQKRIPPLNAIKAFESSARLGSFALAAAELHVTTSAVSQQIRKLEDFLGRQLFVRHNNQLMLTDVGMSVQATSTEMIEGLAEMTARLIDGGLRSNLIISVLPSLGVRWLNRHLSDFLKANKDIRVDLRLEDDPVDFYRNRIDVRISYGEHLYPDYVTLPFKRDSATVMCTPDLLDQGIIRRGDPASIRDTDLIHVSWRNGFSAYPTWDAWFANAGSTNKPRRELGHTVDTSSLAIDLARAGVGVALGQYMLAEDELTEDKLSTPFAIVVPFQYHYCAVYAPTSAKNVSVQAFIDWLSGSARLDSISRA